MVSPFENHPSKIGTTRRRFAGPCAQLTRTNRDVWSSFFGSSKTRSTWQSRCVLGGCVGVGVMLHAYHLAQILRAQDTRSQVSSRPVVTMTPRLHSVFILAETQTLPHVWDFPALFLPKKVRRSPARRAAQLIRAESSSNGSCRSHPALQPTCRNRPALESSSLRSMFLLSFLRGFCSSTGPRLATRVAPHSSSCMYAYRASQSSQGRGPTGPEIIVAHLYSEFWVQSDNMTSGHCHCHIVQVPSSSQVARASTGVPPLEESFVYQSAEIPRYQVGLEVTPDSGGSTCRCRVDDECSSAAPRDGSTD